MKQVLWMLCLSIVLSCMWACSESTSNEPTIEELQKQIQELKNQLEKNSKITAVAFEGSEMVLTFADGTTLRTVTPNSVIPTIGEDGTWWVNGQSLGIKAVAQVPVIGSNGNWWVDGKDSGVSAGGIKGDKGDKGDAGRGISNISYDEATGILTITLTDNSKYEFKLGVISEGGNPDLGGNKLEDLNGSYLVSAIYNGDMPFAQFTYNDQNLMTQAAYYQNVANEAVKIYAMDQDFSNGKTSKQTFSEFAEIDKTVLDGSGYPGQGWTNNELSAQSASSEQLFSELFGNRFAGLSSEVKKEVMERIANLNKQVYINGLGDVVCFVNNSTVYYISRINGTEVRYAKENVVPEGMRFVIKKIGGKTVYCAKRWQSYDAYDTDGDRWEYPDNERKSAFNLNNVDINVHGEAGNEIVEFYPGSNDNFFTPESDYHNTLPAVEKGSSIDVVTSTEIKDYEVPSADEVYNPYQITGAYKYLMAVHKKYRKGDKVRSYEMNYVYDGENFTVKSDGEDQCFIEVSGNKITGVTVIDSVWNDKTGKDEVQKKKVVAMNYNSDGTLASIDCPFENITNVAQCEYDEKKNMTEFRVNASRLKGKGIDDVLCVLGLAYRHTSYDETAGCVIEKVKYTDGPLLKVNYNYGLKNFMNHTWVSINPLFQNVLMNNNAFSELIWAGHGSCYIAEYTNYNNGGYPTEFKGILQIGADMEEWFDASLPVNGSVATLYRLEYKQKK